MVTRTTTTVEETPDPTQSQPGDSPERQRAREKLVRAMLRVKLLSEASMGTTLPDQTHICCEYHREYLLRQAKREQKRWDQFLADFGVVERGTQTSLFDAPKASEDEDDEEDEREPYRTTPTGFRTFQRASPGN